METTTYQSQHGRRMRFLKEVHDLCKGDQNIPVEEKTVAANLGMSDAESAAVVRYLIDRGLLEALWTKTITLTAYGFDTVVAMAGDQP